MMSTWNLCRLCLRQETHRAGPVRASSGLSRPCSRSADGSAPIRIRYRALESCIVNEASWNFSTLIPTAFAAMKGRARCTERHSEHDANRQ